MARSTRIYIAREVEDGQVHTAFTVKHECKAWLASLPDGMIDLLVIDSVPDGVGGVQTYHRDEPAAEFLAR